MKEAIVLSKSDLKKIIAAYYGIEEKDVLPAKYSFTVILEKPNPAKQVEK